MTDLDALEPCPFCGEHLTIRSGVNPYGRCDTIGCWVSERKIVVPLYVEEQVRQWNTRARPTLPASDEVMAEMRKDVEPWSEREKQVILYLCSAQELSETALLRQALRLYELHYERVKAGERVFWSGDAQRQKDFADLSHPPADDREEGDKDRENLVARPSDEVREEGEASPRALAILRQIDDAYSYHMGDPDGEDYDAAKNAAALVIDAALSAIPADPVVKARAYNRGWQDALLRARGTNADMCQSASGAYQLIVSELRKGADAALAAYRGK